MPRAGRFNITAQMRPHLIIQFDRIDEQVHPRIVMQDGKAMRDGIARDIATADIEQPGDGIRQGDHGGLVPGLLQGFGQLAAFLLVGKPGKGLRVNRNRALWRGWPVFPDRVDQVLARGQGQLAPGQRRLKRGSLFGGIEPWIEPDPTAFGQMFLEPFSRFHLRPVHRGKRARIHLRLDLHPVTTIDKNPGPFHQHHTKARRSGEAGEPGQPVIAGCDILALMGIGPWHQKTGQPVLFHCIAQQFQSRRSLIGVGRRVKGLEHLIPPELPAYQRASYRECQT